MVKSSDYIQKIFLKLSLTLSFRQVVPLNDQQHYRNNTNEWIANAHEQTSPNEQFTSISPTRLMGRGGGE